MNQICMDTRLLITGSCVIAFSLLLFYYQLQKYKKQNEEFSVANLYSSLSKDQLKSKLDEIESKLYKTEIQKQECERQLSTIQSNIQTQNLQSQISLERIYNPLVGPERIYPNLQQTDNYQQLGYVSKGSLRLPLFGRRKYKRSDKWEYYVIDNSENKIKVPIKSLNDYELSTGDNITFDGEQYLVNLYEIDSVRYNPDIY